MNNDIHPDDAQWLAQVQVGPIAQRQPADRFRLHLGKPDEEEFVITVVGVPDASMAAKNVLLLT